MRSRILVRSQIAQSRVDSFIVVEVDIGLHRRPGLGQQVIEIRPNLFFSHRPNHTLNIGIIIRSIVTGVLPTYPALAQILDKLLRARLRAVVTADHKIPAKLLAHKTTILRL